MENENENDLMIKFSVKEESTHTKVYSCIWVCVCVNRKQKIKKKSLKKKKFFSPKEKVNFVR